MKVEKPEAPGRSGSPYFPITASAFVATTLIAHVAAQKFIPVGPFVFTGGILLFPVAYILGDVLTEVWGYARARRVIWMALAANALMAGFLAFVVWLPAPSDWPSQEAFNSALGQVPRIVAASLVAYGGGEFANAFVLAKMKIMTRGQHLWLRTIGSSIVGQGVDTILFIVLAFAGVFPGEMLLQAVWSAYLFKVVYEACATPITYAVVGWLKRTEEMDVFDVDTDFTPFSLRAEEVGR